MNKVFAIIGYVLRTTISSQKVACISSTSFNRTHVTKTRENTSRVSSKVGLTQGSGPTKAHSFKVQELHNTRYDFFMNTKSPLFKNEFIIIKKSLGSNHTTVACVLEFFFFSTD